MIIILRKCVYLSDLDYMYDDMTKRWEFFLPTSQLNLNPISYLLVVVDCAVSLTPCLLVYLPISFLHWLLFQWFVKDIIQIIITKKCTDSCINLPFHVVCVLYTNYRHFFASSQKHFCVKQNRQKPIEIMYNEKAHLTFTTWLL